MARAGNFAELLGSRAGLRELKELPVARSLLAMVWWHTLITTISAWALWCSTTVTANHFEGAAHHFH